MRKLPFGVVRSDRGTRLRWLDLHNLLGIVTVICGLVVGITGVVNTLDRPLLGYWQMTEIAEMVAPWKNKNPPARMRPVDEAVRAAEAEVPDMLVRFIAFPGTPFASPYHLYSVHAGRYTACGPSAQAGIGRCGDRAGECPSGSAVVPHALVGQPAPAFR